jgi:hypothetical protein
LAALGLLVHASGASLSFPPGSREVTGGEEALQDSEPRGSGIQITPDESRILINKDVAGERWSITRDLDDQTVTGNVFLADGGALFIFCTQAGLVGDEVELECFGADSCSEASCPDFSFIADVAIPESFFAAPGDLARVGRHRRAPQRPETVAATEAASRPLRERAEGARGSGIQTTPDRKRVLISKDVEGQRWTITRNLDDETVTGNVFFPEGGDPVFLYCERLRRVAGDLELRCFGAERCSETSCPEFTLIGDVTLPISFFEPPSSPASPSPSMPSPGPSPAPTSTGPAPTTPTPTSAPAATPTPSPALTPLPSPSVARPTPSTLEPPTPSPSIAPTPSPVVPTPSPSAAPTASPSPAAVVFRLGIPQTNCRNGVVDVGEECDNGGGNQECTEYSDPDFSGQCAEACTACGNPDLRCAWCNTIGDLGAVQPPSCFSNSCPRGTHGMNADGGLCGTDPFDTPVGDDSLCTVAVSGIGVEGACGLPPVVDFSRQLITTSCLPLICVPHDLLRGSCRQGQRGEPCTLEVDGRLETGTCDRLPRNGPLVCTVERLCPL